LDRDLVEAAQRGDQAAFVDLVRSSGDRLFAIAQWILRDVDRGEDGRAPGPEGATDIFVSVRG
jgi:DNA-directed RNA polymerase specialized sigma24 family protein